LLIRRKKVYLVTISHEDGTPMNRFFDVPAIFALRQMTSKPGLFVDEIRTCSFQFMRLLDDTLNPTKIEKWKTESSPTIFSLLTLQPWFVWRCRPEPGETYSISWSILSQVLNVDLQCCPTAG
jgi:hypothetical protein